MSEQKRPYLTLDETAFELGITREELDELVEAATLKVIRRSDTETVVARWALEAYLRNQRGEGPLAELKPPLSGEDAMAEFLVQTGGVAPRDFYLAFKRGEIEDTSENMMLLVEAIGLDRDPKCAEIDRLARSYRRDRCVDTGEPCQCIRGSIAEAHCLAAKRRRPFEEFLASRGLTMREWQERYRARDPEAYRVQLLWWNRLDAEAKGRGELVEFNETALAELGISLSKWWAMAPGDRVRTMLDWFDGK